MCVVGFVVRVRVVAFVCVSACVRVCVFVCWCVCMYVRPICFFFAFAHLLCWCVGEVVCVSVC